ncbi:MerR family transcriptional regulator [Amphiplicatus metriothermophilus]|uniref:MerR family transcriptional regulator, mercuric resistance operon regulatory protein n=2 Tax=Amphiplicatus metriothermophilus TaxID=1519374 RepID=A0A239PRE9_9PROT|nr:helix-turn-helix domain-containing protein [Amphiplicatus metriothermophilus]SNT72466.1 MerR family transcriptional regulator, mercuric resistance operon regulatory protein [Amphiplicatus metriothermophilus]
MTFTVARGSIKRGELARRSGCNLETIRYYEDVGLMPPPARTQAGHRLYREDDQRRLRFILRARELGFSIAEIRSLLSIIDSAEYTCGEVYALTQAHLRSVSAKIADLKKLEQTLKTISKGCAAGSAPECPIVDALIAD